MLFSVSAEVPEEPHAPETARGVCPGGWGGTSVGQTQVEPPERLHQPRLPEAWLLQQAGQHEDWQELRRQPGLSQQSPGQGLAFLSQVGASSSSLSIVSNKIIFQMFRNICGSFWITSTILTITSSSIIFYDTLCVLFLCLTNLEFFLCHYNK